ncbi:hypothetical protein ACM1RC_31535 [Paenibacillus azoreducens]|uniref:hypothetical protein n=1 Tax=Paenibacillus azoreducens TaxID=116718 RepID=UPI0039F46C2C
MVKLSPEAIEARRKHGREYKRKWRQKLENKQKENTFSSNDFSFRLAHESADVTTL